MESLSDKLKSLGVQLGLEKPLQTVEVNKLSIEQVVDGRYFDTPFGQAFVVEAEYDPSTTNGMPIAEQMGILSEWANSPALPLLKNEEIIFLDTETSGLSGGTGTFAFMIGLGYFSDHCFKLIQLFMRDPSEEPGLLSAFHHFLGNFKAVVTYNGKSFDIPLLNTRHVINSISSPFGDILHIDLLPLARRLWRNRLPSRALKDLEIELLNVHRSQKEVSGWMVPELYYNYLRFGDAQPLAGVFYHNGMDVVSLASLFNFTADLISHPLENPAVDSLDLIAIARLYDHLGRVDEAIRIYEKSLEQGLPISFFHDTVLRFAAIHRKRNEWSKAVSLWEMGAHQSSIPSCIELSKFYEHQEKDLNKAIEWVQQAIAFDKQCESPLFSQELIARLSRINRKIQMTTK